MGSLPCHVPVDASLPRSVGEAVEDVQHKGSSVALVGPVLLDRRLGRAKSAVVCLLELVTEAIDDHDEREQGEQGNLGAHRAAKALVVERKPKDVGADDLEDVVARVVEGASAEVEVGTVDLGKVICVEPVGGEEHGEQGEDVGVGEECLPETHNLGFPRGVLHDDDLGAIVANHVLGINKRP